jgi:hypothetical protein
MPVDVEQQLSDLGKFWNNTIAHVDPSEIGSRGTAPSSRSLNGIDVPAPALGPGQPRAIYQFTKEDATMIDLEQPPLTDENRRGPKRVVVAALAAAAAVAAIALVAIRDDDPVSPADQPSSTITSPPTLPPRALFGTLGERLTPATYSIETVEGAPTPEILVTIGEGWSTYDDWALIKSEEEGRVVSFSVPDRVFVDACNGAGGDHPGPLTTLDGLVTALTEQRGWIDVTTPSDISIDGYAGKAFQRSTPADLSDCPLGFTSWSQTVYDPGSTNTVWVLDLAGTIIVVETRVDAGQPAEAHAEVAAMLESIRIAPA